MTVFYDSYLVTYHVLIAMLYFLQFFLLLKELATGSFKRPFLSLKNLFATVLVLVTCFLLFAFPLMDQFYWLLLIDLAVPIITAFFVFVLLFPSELYADWQIEKASCKISRQKELMVIAITGSTAKSSTKDAVAHVLGKKFKVVKTQGADTTIEQTARTILDSVTSDTDLFIVDLNAYRKGEIASFCRVLRPKIGIMTSISGHSLSLFKTRKNIEKVNFELIEALPKNGLGIFNVTNKNTYKLYKKTKKPKAFFALSKPDNTVLPAENGIIASDIVQRDRRISFTVIVQGKSHRFTVRSGRRIEHLLPAIYLAIHLGMKEREIRTALASLK